MAKNDFLVKYGTLTKEETLVSIENKISPNTFVLEANNPYPGYYEYYQEIPKEVKPYYIYFVTDRKYELEDFMRVTQKIMGYFGHTFDAALGTIKIFNDIFPVIRIRYLKDYDQIEELQACYLEEGIKFKPKPPKPVNAKTMIYLEKFFALTQLEEEGYFLDYDEGNHGYFTIPQKINWKQFERLTKQVKYNIELLHFDASLGTFYDYFKVYDVIRVYAENLSLDIMKEIRKKYVERIK